jgi:ATP-binding cassette subfamily B protein
VAEPAQPERFTLQEYFTPGERRRISKFPHLVRTAFAMVWRAAPRQLVFAGLLQIGMAIALAGQLLVVRALLTELLSSSGNPSFGDVLPEVLALSGLAAVVSIAGTLVDFQQRILGQVVALDATEEVIRTATGVDLITYDSPGFHDRLQRGQMSASTRPAQLVTGLFGVIGGSVAIGGIAIALLLVQPVFCLLVLVAFIPAWFATNRAGRLIYQFSVEQTERERVRMYLFDLLTSKREAQEVRAFDLAGFLGKRHRTIYERQIEDLRVVLRRRLRIALAGQLATAALTAAVLGVVVYFVTSDRMSLSEAGTAMTGLVLMSARLRGLAGSAGGLYESSLYLEDYSTFVAAAPRIEASRPTGIAPVDPQVVEADSVSFTYPSRTEPSLADASLVLRRGEVVALVGENGSGKTTFAKLLAGLYSSPTGAITWDGMNTEGFDPATLRARVAVIFQDFARYQLSAHENISMGDPTRAGDLAMVEEAAHAAGVHDEIQSLDGGYGALLGPEYYGGSDFSLGQWQRVALARAFFRGSPIVILDEPTASLDPRAEASLYANMRDLFAGRAVLLISHRFGSVRTADRIYVLREGRIIETGDHRSLMAEDGYYAELFQLQASSYVD